MTMSALRRPIPLAACALALAAALAWPGTAAPSTSMLKMSVAFGGMEGGRPFSP